MKITIKIVSIDQESYSVLVKYVSENSKKSIDEYSAMAFQIPNQTLKTPEEFIEIIKPQVSFFVWQRDQQENPSQLIDLSTWSGYTTEVESIPIVAPLNQVIPTLNTLYTQPEVEL